MYFVQSILCGLCSEFYNLRLGSLESKGAMVAMSQNRALSVTLLGNDLKTDLCDTARCKLGLARRVLLICSSSY